MPRAERDYVTIALDYARSVVSGGTVAGKWERRACQRHLDDLVRAAAPGVASFYFDDTEAWNACDFIEKLPHVEGVWETPHLQLEPWQVFILVCVFGYRRSADGLRRFNTAYIEVGRKNAKSTLTSGVTLYCLTCEGEVGPQVKVAATTGKQARIVFDVAKRMVERTSDLREAFGLDPMANAIVCDMNGGSIQPINSKASTQDGLNPHLAVLDELHAHKDRSLFDVLKSARGARKNPLSWYITTAGYNIAGVCFEQRTIVQKILDGIFPGDHYFGVIYTIDDDDDPYDEANWRKANPNLNISVQLEEMRGYAAEAKASPASQGEYLTKRLNRWLAAAAAWLNMTQWDACGDPTLKIEQFRGLPAWIGVDLSSKNDVASAVIVFERGGVLFAFARFYLPKDLVEACAHRTHTHYLTWSQAGLFTLTPGDMIDYDFIEKDLRQWSSAHDVRAIAFDPYQSQQITTTLFNAGLPALTQPINVATLSEPSKELEARVQVLRFRHDGNPVLRWMASNVTVLRDQKGNIFPRKEKPHSPNKIDGIMAAAIAIKQWLTPPAPDERSVYEDRAPLPLVHGDDEEADETSEPDDSGGWEERV